ncbi:hypothetical protein LVJ94_24850 [Pendulispora rubella]|uniref:NHL repeat-containing protein n=1 Tax=Pendulispora rubella TaxID=2741070 RepID=A0ABZ2LHL9_9BACT
MKTNHACRSLVLSISVFAGCSSGGGEPRQTGALPLQNADPMELALLAGAIGGHGTADGVGEATRFHDPMGIAVDSQGNAYVADEFNNAIRKIVLATGEVSTLAGSSRDDPGSADGTGTDARFFRPHGVVADGAGHLYVADSFNDTIRKIDLATGEVSTFAGTARESGSTDGIGAAARFDLPEGLALDSAGHLFVSDYLGETIRQIVLATGEVSTVAGSPRAEGSTDGVGVAARFRSPTGLAADDTGSVYVVDGGNSTIRKIVVATRQVSTFAGSARQTGSTDGAGKAARFSYPRGIVRDAAGDLYVADSWNYQVRKISVATAKVSTVAGLGTSDVVDGIGRHAKFGEPYGIAADGSGNLYVTEKSYHVVRKVALANSQVTTFAGVPKHEDTVDGVGPAARFMDHEGMAADGNGNVFIADRFGKVIRKMVLATGEVTAIAGFPGRSGSSDGIGENALFNFPEGITSDGDGHLYVTDAWNNTIRRIDIATREVVTIAGTAGGGGSTDGVGPQARFFSPQGITCDRAGHLYVADWFNGTIRAIDLATRNVTTLAGTASQYGSEDGIGPTARFSWPYGIASDFAGHLYVSDYDLHTIRKIDVATAQVSTFAGSPGEHTHADGVGAAARFDRPAELTIDTSGRLIVADEGNSAIRSIDAATAEVSTVAGTRGLRRVSLGQLPTTLNYPRAVVALDDGQLLVTDENAILTLRKVPQ